MFVCFVWTRCATGYTGTRSRAIVILRGPTHLGQRYFYDRGRKKLDQRAQHPHLDRAETAATSEKESRSHAPPNKIRLPGVQFSAQEESAPAGSSLRTTP